MTSGKVQNLVTRKFNWKTSLKALLVILRCVGMWPKNDETYKLDLYLIYTLTIAIFFYFGFNLSQMINIYYVFNDLEALTGSVLLLITNLLAMMKMAIFVKNLRNIKNLLKILNTKFYPKPQEVDLLEKSMSGWKKGYTYFSCVVACNLLIWSVAPIMDLKDRELPFPGWFPFNVKKTPFYQLAYLYQILSIWPMTLCNLNLDCLSVALMMFTKSLCELLCFKLENLKGENFGEELIECIKSHKIILRFAKDSNNFFSVIVLGQFATSTAVIAFIMFQLTLVSPSSSEGMSHVAYINGITTELFLYCWFGNEVELKSMNIPYAVYKSDWISQPISVKRNMLILCLRCRQPIKMTAIKLFTLSLDTFLAIIRSAYSYFALLSSVDQ